MKISCYCLTYRTPELLEEAIFSFLQQDYAGDKELIILNDEPKQTLIYNHPQIRIVNMPSRATDIVSKYNHAVSLCTGDICVPWDDDDICLPHRLSTIVSEGKNGLWYSDNLFTDTDEDAVEFTTGIIHNNHALDIRRFIQFGAYHNDVGRNNGYDFAMMSGIRATFMSENSLIKSTSMPSYIYRKNSIKAPNHSNHIGKDKENHYKNYSDELDDFKEGPIVLCPRWSRDWTSMCLREWGKRPIPKKLHEVDAVYPDMGVSKDTQEEKDLEEN